MVDHVIFSPRINLRYNPTEQINLRLNYAGGFRAPQTFDEDLHIALVGGRTRGHAARPRPARGAFEQPQRLDRPLPLLRQRGDQPARRRLLHRTRPYLRHALPARTQRKGRNGARTLQRRRSDRGRRQRRGEGGLLPLVRLAGRHHMAAQPLRTRPALERRRARRTPHVPFARLVRLPDSQLRPRAAVRHLAVGHLHRRDARPARRRFGHAGRRGGHHARLLRAERQTGLRIPDPPNAHPATQRRRARISSTPTSRISTRAGSAIPATSTGRRCRAAGSSGRKSASENRCGDTRKKGDVRTTRLPYRSPPANPTYSHTEKRRTQAFRAACWQAAALSSVTGVCPFGSGRNVLPPISVRRQGATSAWNHVQAAV